MIQTTLAASFFKVKQQLRSEHVTDPVSSWFSVDVSNAEVVYVEEILFHATGDLLKVGDFQRFFGTNICEAA